MSDFDFKWTNVCLEYQNIFDGIGYGFFDYDFVVEHEMNVN